MMNRNIYVDKYNILLQIVTNSVTNNSRNEHCNSVTKFRLWYVNVYHALCFILMCLLHEYYHTLLVEMIIYCHCTVRKIHLREEGWCLDLVCYVIDLLKIVWQWCEWSFWYWVCFYSNIHVRDLSVLSVFFWIVFSFVQ